MYVDGCVESEENSGGENVLASNDVSEHKVVIWPRPELARATITTRDANRNYGLPAISNGR